jgi:hypothetical protein
MKFESKFDLGQKVWLTSVHDATIQVPKECELCNSKGVIDIVGKETPYLCPECFGLTTTKVIGKEMYIYKSGLIGKINIEQYSEKYKEKNRITYMISSTGVGSGTIWDEYELYSSEEEAKKACEEFNIKNQSN